MHWLQEETHLLQYQEEGLQACAEVQQMAYADLHLMPLVEIEVQRLEVIMELDAQQAVQYVVEDQELM